MILFFELDYHLVGENQKLTTCHLVNLTSFHLLLLHDCQRSERTAVMTLMEMNYSCSRLHF